MKIIVVTNLYPPFARGGAEYVAQLTVEGLRRLGHDVVVLTATPCAGLFALWPTLSLEEGVRVYRWYPLNLYFIANAARYPAWLRTIWTMLDLFNMHSWLVARWILSQERPEVIISHNLKGLGYTLPRLLARRTSRYIHVLHDVQLAYPTGLLYPETMAKILQQPMSKLHIAITRWLLGTVPNIVSPSNFLLKFYRGLNFFESATVRLVVNPVALGEASQQHEGINVVFVGQLEYSKGIDVLLEVWNEIKSVGATLHVVGDGSLRMVVEAKTAQSATIIYHGRLDGEALEVVWRQADILVLSSRCLENAPIVISEALARGCAIVASDVGGVRELAMYSSKCRLVPPGDVSALAQALIAVIETCQHGERPAIVLQPKPEEYVTRLLS